MKKYVCTVCGYIAEGEIPAQCPVCKAPASAFVEKTGNTYVTEHVVGIGKAEGVPQEIVDGLRANFEGECAHSVSEVSLWDGLFNFQGSGERFCIVLSSLESEKGHFARCFQKTF